MQQIKKEITETLKMLQLQSSSSVISMDTSCLLPVGRVKKSGWRTEVDDWRMCWNLDKRVSVPHFLLQQINSSRMVEMKYGQKTSRWQKSLSTDTEGERGRREEEAEGSVLPEGEGEGECEGEGVYIMVVWGGGGGSARDMMKMVQFIIRSAV